MEINRRIETINTYDQNAGRMAERFDAIGPRTEDIEKAFSYLRGVQNPKVFEIGSANGRDASEITKRTENYLGIDISPELVKIAKKRLPDATFQVADAATFKFPTEQDIIFAFASLLHENKQELKNIVDKISRALSSKGIFYISSMYGEHRGELREDEYGPRTFYLYTPEDVLEASEKQLEMVEREIQKFHNQQWFTAIYRKAAK